jgi:hypothetical protein
VRHDLYASADCICQPIVTDLVESEWTLARGVIARRHPGDPEGHRRKVAMVGGIDGRSLISQTSRRKKSAAEVRRAIDTYCSRRPVLPSFNTAYASGEWNNASHGCAAKFGGYLL